MQRTLAVLALASLAACSGRSDGDLNPGNWRLTATVKSASLPDAPAAMQAQVAQMTAQMVGKSQTQEQCMTPAEAKIENISRSMQQGNCTTEGFETGGGRLSGRMTCTTGASGRAELAMTGTYEPEKININADMTISEPNVPGGKVKMTMEMAANRIGDCPAS